MIILKKNFYDTISPEKILIAIDHLSTNHPNLFDDIAYVYFDEVESECEIHCNDSNFYEVHNVMNSTTNIAGEIDKHFVNERKVDLKNKSENRNNIRAFSKIND